MSVSHWRREANGQWLYWTRRDQGEEEEEKAPDQQLWDRIANKRNEYGWPPAYLAIVVMDWDRMGYWLRGEMNSTPIK